MKTKEKPTLKPLEWFDNNILIVVSGLLLVLIPLMPKIPLLDILPGYIVRIRIEDFAILGASILWLVQVFRKKARWRHPFFYLILVYLLIGFLSSISALFITKSVPLEPLHAGKMFLHYFRRIEYFMLAAIFFSAVKNLKHLKILVSLLVFVVIAVCIYGFGQKYFYWPVYSTMNREFSKGIKLYLSEHARVPSTFGGHYDLAAFLVIILPIMLSLYFTARNKTRKYAYGTAFIFGYITLNLTASRTSFLAYLSALGILMLFYKSVRSWKWIFSRAVILGLFTIIVMFFVGDLADRFTQLPLVKNYKDKILAVKIFPQIQKPKDYLTQEDLVASKSDVPPSSIKPTESSKSANSNLPPDVYEAIDDVIITASGAAITKDRTYSDNAYEYGLSASIRYDTLWPRAYEGLKKNVLLGSGYSTLTKESTGQFTEAESTDNDYLRTLGETGILGFISFYGIVIGLIYFIFKKLESVKDNIFLFSISLGFISGSIGLLVNAVYIDVFAASKVAEIYWAISGMILAVLYNVETKKPHA